MENQRKRKELTTETRIEGGDGFYIEGEVWGCDWSEEKFLENRTPNYNSTRWNSLWALGPFLCQFDLVQFEYPGPLKNTTFFNPSSNIFWHLPFLYL